MNDYTAFLRTLAARKGSAVSPATITRDEWIAALMSPSLEEGLMPWDVDPTVTPADVVAWRERRDPSLRDSPDELHAQLMGEARLAARRSEDEYRLQKEQLEAAHARRVARGGRAPAWLGP